MFDVAPSESRVDRALHHAVIRSLIDIGRAPTRSELAVAVGANESELAASLRRLEASHSVVLHPGTTDVWIVHPFSTSPTHTWIAKGDRGFWAPCLWCGLGVATLVGGDVTIHSRIGGESEAISLAVRDGVPEETSLIAHFPQPPRDAWKNVHHFCARLLPFRSADEISAWCLRHGLPEGRAVPIRQLADLASRWYGGHADSDWRKFTVAEAANIFEKAGLTGEFWSLEVRDGAF